MLPIAQTRVEQIVQELMPYVAKQRIDEITLQRFKRDARKNLGAHPWAGYIALEMIAVLEWDEAGIDHNHKQALGYRNSSDTYAHYSTSLQLIGKYIEASDAILTASKMVPENLSYAMSAIHYAQSAGRFNLARDLITSFNLRSPKNPYDEDLFEMVLSVIEKNKVSEETITQCNKVAFDILRQHRIPFVGTKFRGDAQDDYVMFYVTLSESQETIERLDEELGVALFDQVPDFDPSKYWVGYSKAVDNE